MPKYTPHRTVLHYIFDFFWITIGALLAALAIRVFLVPNFLIDGGTIGIALILSRLFGEYYLSYFLIILNLPFVYLAFKYIRRSFVLHMFSAIVLFAFFLWAFDHVPAFHGDPVEIIVIAGALLGIGGGLIIRSGGCLDGTEIMGIIINRRLGFTVGQVVLVCNIFIFTAYGWIFSDWHIAFQSLLMYVVAFKMIDIVIVGLDEMKSVLIISSNPKHLADVILNELGLGLTVMNGRGGFSGDKRELLFVILERLDLAALKEIVLREDPMAFMAVENLHEVVYGKSGHMPFKKKGGRLKRIFY